MKLRCAVLLRLGLKWVKIFWNVSKVCMHAGWSNWHPNLWSNLNSRKLLEKETPSCGFNRVGVHACLSNMDPNLWSSFNSENLVKVETPSCSFVRVWLKDGESWQNWNRNLWSNLNSKKLLESETPSCGFDRVTKVGVHACLSNMDPNLSSGFNSESLVKAETTSCSFVRVCLKDGENSSQHRESVHALWFCKCGFKSMIKF